MLDCEGAALDPQRLLASLSEDMPLSLAADTLGRMLTSLQHRRRHACVLRNLHKSANIAARIAKVEALSERVVVGDETPCRGCGRRIGGRVFYRYPSGAVMCDRCAKAGEGGMASALPVGTAHQQQSFDDEDDYLVL